MQPMREDPAAEIQAARLDAERLVREGIPEPQVLAQLDQRRVEPAAISSKHVERPLKQPRPRVLSPAFLSAWPRRSQMPETYLSLFAIWGGVVFLGFIFEVTVGRTFVFAQANSYRSSLPWFLALLVPLFGCLWYAYEQTTFAFGKAKLTWWVRWLFVFPFVTTVMSLLTILAPLGWLAAYGFLLGKPVQDVRAKLISVDEPRSTKRGCQQHAVVDVIGNTARICLDSPLTGRMPIAGDELLASGRLSSAGIFIDELQAK